MGIPDAENYFFVTILIFGLFGVVAVVKSVRDKEDGIPVTGAFLGLSWLGATLPLIII